MLASLIEERHDDIDPVCLAVDGGDHPLEVLEMVVGGHMVFKSVHLVGDGVVRDVHENKDVLASGGSLKNCLAFACGKTGEKMRKPVILFIVSLISGIIAVFVVVTCAEIVDPAVDLLTEFLRGRENDKGERRNRVACLLEFVVQHMICSHEISFFCVYFENKKYQNI